VFCFPIKGYNFFVICKTTFLVTWKCSTHHWLSYWFMRKLEYQVVFWTLTQLLTSFVINRSKSQKNQKWCKITLSLTWLTYKLTPCVMKFVVRSVINLMVSSSTSGFTKKNPSNYKSVWRKTINNNFSGVTIGSWNSTNKTNRKSGGLEWWIVLCTCAISDESFGVHSQVMNAAEQGAMCSNRELTRKMEKAS